MKSNRLRSGGLYWPTQSPPPSLHQTLPDRLEVDVLVLGAGITGAFVAFTLVQAGATVAVLDSRGIAQGSTPASTALLMYELDVPLVELTERLGDQHAQNAYRASRATLHDMPRVCASLPGDVKLASRPSLHLAVRQEDVQFLHREARARSAIGINVEPLDRQALISRFGIDRPGALLSADGLEVDPFKLTVALFEAAQTRRCHLLPRGRVNASALAQSGRPFCLGTSCGCEVTARHVVIATGYETPEQFAQVAALTELRSTYVIATTPQPGEPWPQRALLWDMDDPYFYARTTSDGRILVGGEDEPFTSPAKRDALIPAKAELLMGKLRALIPNCTAGIDFRWAGTFAETADGLPYIGAHERWPDVHFALGYGGNGITFSLLAAQIIADTISGRTNPSAQLFTFDRGTHQPGVAEDDPAAA